MRYNYHYTQDIWYTISALGRVQKDGLFKPIFFIPVNILYSLIEIQGYKNYIRYLKKSKAYPLKILQDIEHFLETPEALKELEDVERNKNTDNKRSLLTENKH